MIGGYDLWAVSVATLALIGLAAAVAMWRGGRR